MVPPVLRESHERQNGDAQQQCGEGNDRPIVGLKGLVAVPAQAMFGRVVCVGGFGVFGWGRLVRVGLGMIAVFVPRRGWVRAVIFVMYLGDEFGEQKYGVQQNKNNDAVDGELGGLAHTLGIRFTLRMLVVVIVVDVSIRHGTRVLPSAPTERALGVSTRSIDSIVGKMTQCLPKPNGRNAVCNRAPGLLIW